MTTNTPEFVLIDSRKTLCQQLGINRTFQISKSGDFDAALQASGKDSLWILNDRGQLANNLLKSLVSWGPKARNTPDLGHLLFSVRSPRPSLVPPLHAYFRSVTGDMETFQTLPTDQLAVVLTSPDKADLFIGGSVDGASQTVTLVRWDMRTLAVPFSIFRPSATSRPDFDQFELDDYGYAVRLGDYESSAHAILFEVDRDYRRRFNQQRVQSEKGFGASLRRLRLLRQLSRSAFGNIAAKTIARLERGETAKPHGTTLNRIASILGVAPEEIESY